MRLVFSVVTVRWPSLSSWCEQRQRRFGELAANFDLHKRNRRRLGNLLNRRLLECSGRDGRSLRGSSEMEDFS